MKVLVVKTSSMGDVIHAFPALTDAIAARPDLVVDWCVERAFADIVRLHPRVRNVHEVAMREWRGDPFSAETRRAFSTFRRTVRAEQYDLVIDAQGLFKSALLASLAGAPVAGFDRHSAREPLATLAYSRRYPVARDKLAIERQRLLFGQALGYEPDFSRLDYGLTPPPGGDERTAFLLHGTTWPSKKWPLESWIELAQGLAASGYIPELTYGNDAERTVAEAVAATVPAARVVVEETLGGIASAIARADVVVGADTGLTHLACAFDKPTVQIFLSTSPGLTRSPSRRSDVLASKIACAPCYRRDCPLVPKGEVQPCAALVTPDAVLRRLEELASGTDPNHAA